jgi:hypothetical protein
MTPRVTGAWRAAPWELARRSLRVKLGLLGLLAMASMALALGALMFSTAKGCSCSRPMPSSCVATSTSPTTSTA